MQKKKSKAGVLLTIALLGLLVAVFSFVLASRFFLPKMIVRKAEKKEILVKVQNAITELNIENSKAIDAIEKLDVDQVKYALEKVNEAGEINSFETVAVFIRNLHLEDVDPKLLLSKIDSKKKQDEAAELIKQLSKNTNKLFIMLPIIKDTLIEAIKKSSKEK